MKISISHNIKQHHTLAPKVQQAIRLLQLSSIELQQEIIKNMTDNPLLDIDDESTNLFENIDVAAEQNNTEVDNDDNTIDEVMALTSLYVENPHGLSLSAPYTPEAIDKTTETLHDYLIWQLNLAKLTKKENDIALHLIDAINEDGFFTGSIADIKKSIRGNISKNKVEQILRLIQHFDPIGVGSKNMTGFLLFQLDNEHRNMPNAYYQIASKIIKNDLVTLARHDYQALCKKYKIGKPDLQQILKMIVNLKTSPNLLHNQQPSSLIPDIILEQYDGDWSLEINHCYYNVKLNKNNIELLQKQKNNKKTKDFLKEKLKSANWFIHCLAQRDQSLILVTKAIMDFQHKFLQYGAGELKPLTLKQIAKKTGLHESTISRVVNNKSIQTPRGVFPLKFFFSSQVQTKNKKTSSKKVYALIKNLVSNENPKKPFSDQQITNKLNSKYGLTIARRTISKYREALGILPSRFRRKLQPKEVT